MRRIISLLSDYRKVQLKQARAGGYQVTDQRIAETADMFRWLDNNLSGIKPTDTCNRLQEVKQA